MIVAWEVEVTDKFKAWWNKLTDAECVSIESAVILLEDRGPHLPYSYSSKISSSSHSAMRELRVQHKVALIECSTFLTPGVSRFCY